MSSSESESSSSSEERKKKKKKDKKAKKKDKKVKKKEKSKKDKKRDKRKKEKEKRLKKDRKAREKLGMLGSVSGQYGQYGVLTDADLYRKRPEFHAWLLDIKKMQPETMSQWEEKRIFADFCEDHNTATFPSRKYYDLDTYDRCKVAENQRKKADKAADNKAAFSSFDDEKARRQEIEEMRNKKKSDAMRETLENLKKDKSLAQDMMQQKQLQAQMTHSLKSGNFEEAEKIRARLAPTEDKSKPERLPIPILTD